MISDEDIIAMIVEAATEELPIAVMTVREMRQFAEKVAMDCVAIAEIPNMAVRALSKPAVDARQQAIIADMYRGTPLATRVTEGWPSGPRTAVPDHNPPSTLAGADGRNMSMPSASKVQENPYNPRVHVRIKFHGQFQGQSI